MKPKTIVRTAGAFFLAAGLIAAGCESKEETKTATPAAPSAAAEPAVPAAATQPSAQPSASGAATTAPAMSATEAQTKLDQVTQYIKENKLDLAEKTLKQLEDNKAQLPVGVADKLPQVRSALNAAKGGSAVKDAAGGLKIP